MKKIEFHLSLGESDYDPHDFVRAVTLAEKLGFEKVWLGDHFVPWVHSGRTSAFVWAVMSAGLQKTEHIALGPLVCTPIGGRYHPALVAQASATMDNMHPGRFLLGVGSGEAVNERVFFNNRWPEWSERMDRLVEGTGLIRALWEKEEPFSFDGKYFPSDFYYLYTKPSKRIPIYFAAMGKKGAYNAGKYGDHLVTLALPKNSPDRLRDELVPSFVKGCKEAGKVVGDVLVEIIFTLDNPEKVWRSQRQKFGMFATNNGWSLRTPIEVEKRGEAMTVSDLKRAIYFCKDWNDVIELIEQYRQAGVTAVSLGTGPDEVMMKECVKNVLPSF